MTHYEAHITVFDRDAIPAEDLGRFMDVSERLGGHVLMIQLLGTDPKKFEQPLQVMFARKVELYNDAEAENWITWISEMIAKDGFQPKRVKLEAEFGSIGSVKYYESHWKLNAVPATNSSNSVYLSRSLQDRTKVWATARSSRQSSQSSVERHFNEVERYLKSLKTYVAGSLDIAPSSFFVENQSRHYERVILDTNPALDAGWAPTL